MTEDMAATGSVPVPDPTKLTTDAVNAATAQWRRDLQSLRELTEARFASVADINSERFASIALQFAERDVRTTLAASAATDALSAALQAAKELVGAQGEAAAAAAVKSETSFTKQIDQIGTIIQTLEKALDARITELKERIDRGEGSHTGRQEQEVSRRADSGLSLQFAAIVLSAIIVGLALYAALHK